ncbi:hypothetical protein HDU98_011925 [Podochytrium sp. JEL0797]|nr:hypothetical protein HDU98_011925 [Podochytrium sp. JEL0797]
MILGLLLVAVTVAASPIDRRQTTCTFGAYQCSGANVQQCAYGADSTLSWTTVQACASGTVCSASGYVGCLPGSAPATTTAAVVPTTTIAVPKTTATTSAAIITSAKTTAVVPPTSAATTTPAAPKTTASTTAVVITSTTTTVAVPTTPSTTIATSALKTTTVAATTAVAGGNVVGASCSTFAGYVCDGSNDLLQCTYNSANALVWSVLMNCNTSNTVCKITGSTGNCVTPPVQTGGGSPSITPVPFQPITGAKKVIYNDNTQYTSGNAYPASLGVPGFASTTYNVFNLAFWLRTGPADSAYYWAALDANTRQTYVNAFHSAGKAIMVSAFGATDMPTGDDPVKVATNLANWVIANQLDGADIDYEDSAAFENGSAEAWLTSFTTTLRQLLPSPRYIISHAPQAPYFVTNTAQYPKGAYLTVDKNVGSLIDFYNVQFYNQGSTDYIDCQGLLTKSVGFFTGTSLFEIAAKGVALNKLVIGKPVTTAGATNTGYMTPALLASCVSQAKAQGWNGGVMGWQLNLDNPMGSWMATVGAAL